MRQKQFIVLGAIVLMLGILLTACSQSNKESAETHSGNSAESSETQVISGTINRTGDFLVLLTDDGAYQVMELGDGISLDNFSEGDYVKVTYTGELGNEDASPIISAIEKAK